MLITNCLNQLQRFTLTFALALAFLTIFGQPLAAQNNHWEYIGTSADGIVFYIDKNNFERSGGEVSLWEKSIFPDGSYQTNLSKWQCAEMKTILITSNIYTPQGSLVGRKSVKDWNRLIPDSIGEAMYKAACNVEFIRTPVAEAAAENIRVTVKLANIRDLPFNERGNRQKSCQRDSFSIDRSRSRSRSRTGFIRVMGKPPGFTAARLNSYS